MCVFRVPPAALAYLRTFDGMWGDVRESEEGEEEDSDSEIAREEAAHHASNARCGLGAC